MGDPNPQIYGQFGLPGHDGLDFAVAIGSPVLCIGDGIVYQIHTNPDNHNYGLHVRVVHPDGRLSIYSRLSRIDVTPNQSVVGGQQLGLSGNTGNSTGPHLHLSMKESVEQSYTDALGNVWPYNLTNPWKFIGHLYQLPDRVLKTGYVYKPYLTIGSDGQAVNFNSNLNMRTGAGNTHPILGSVPSLSLLEVLGNEQNNYILVSAWTVQSQPPTLPPTGNASIGLHASADPGDLPNGEFAEFQALRPDVIKVLSAHSPQSVSRLAP